MRESNRLYCIYFSPTGGVKRGAEVAASAAATVTGLPIQYIDITPINRREKIYEFKPDDLVLLFCPVYAGRVPNKLRPDLRAILKGNGARLLCAAVYGGRSPGGTLPELLQIGSECGFIPVAGAEIVSTHAFFDEPAGARPDPADAIRIRSFIERVLTGKTDDSRVLPLPAFEGRELPPYYMPLREDGSPARFLQAIPVTDAQKCAQCGVCASRCPMGSIDAENPSQVDGICIKCYACIRICKRRAKRFTDKELLSHIAMLRQTLKGGKEPVFYFTTDERETN